MTFHRHYPVFSFGEAYRKFSSMTSELSPLAHLADVVASKKEIERILRPMVEAEIAGCLNVNYPRAKARTTTREVLLAFLKTRGFAGFSKKRLLDKLISKVMREIHYSARLRSQEFEDDRDADRSVKYYRRVTGKKVSPTPSHMRLWNRRRAWEQQRGR
jgi:hypothetical protein